MNLKPALYSSPISLAEGKSGKVSVKHRTETGTVTIVGIRQAITCGIQPMNGKLSEPRIIHSLIEEDQGVWMTDSPEELNQIAQMFAEVLPRGRVLVGGLGLGVVAKAMTLRTTVSEVVVVERNEDVIKLCAEPGAEYRVVHADIFDYLRTHERAFDCYLLDTWQGTNEATWWDTVLPLRRIIRSRFGNAPKVHCWAEDIMQGQIFSSLVGQHRVWYYKDLPHMTPKTAGRFLRNVGSEQWERLYGAIVDEALRRRGAD